MPSAAATSAKVNNSRDPERTTWSNSHGIARLPITSIRVTKTAILAKVSASGIASRPSADDPASTAAASVGMITRTTTVNRSFDDQRTDRDAAVGFAQQAAFCKGAQHDDRARNRQRQPKDDTGADRPAPNLRQAKAEHRREPDLPDCSRHRNPAHGEQIADREMHGDAKHQQDDADLGELARQMGVATKPGVNGPIAIPANR